jgi:hypothetical protein
VAAEGVWRGVAMSPSSAASACVIMAWAALAKHHRNVDKSIGGDMAYVALSIAHGERYQSEDIRRIVIGAQ